MLDYNKKFTTEQIRTNPAYGALKDISICDAEGVDAVFDPSWQACVPYQPQDKYGRSVFNLAYKNDATTGAISLEVFEHIIPLNEYIYTEDTIEGAVVAVLESFPQKEVDNNWQLQNACNDVARTTRRGMANRNWNNTWYYVGTGNSQVDCGFVVSSTLHRGETHYAIWKSDIFDDYGFTVKRFDRMEVMV